MAARLAELRARRPSADMSIARPASHGLPLRPSVRRESSPLRAFVATQPIRLAVSDAMRRLERSSASSTRPGSPSATEADSTFANSVGNHWDLPSPRAPTAMLQSQHRVDPWLHALPVGLSPGECLPPPPRARAGSVSRLGSEAPSEPGWMAQPPSQAVRVEVDCHATQRPIRDELHLFLEHLQAHSPVAYRTRYPSESSVAENLDQDKRCGYFVARVGGGMIGFVTVEPDPSQSGRVTRIDSAFLAAHGRQEDDLIEAALAALYRAGIERCSFAVPARNPARIDRLSRNGWEVQERGRDEFVHFLRWTCTSSDLELRELLGSASSPGGAVR